MHSQGVKLSKGCILTSKCMDIGSCVIFFVGSFSSITTVYMTGTSLICVLNWLPVYFMQINIDHFIYSWGTGITFLDISFLTEWANSALLIMIDCYNKATVGFKCHTEIWIKLRLRELVKHLVLSVQVAVDKKLCLCQGTARHAMSAEILSTAAQLYEKKSHLKKLEVGE